MQKGSSFARACYAVFAVAVLMAVLKLGATSGAEPLFVKTVPTESAAKTSEPTVGRQAPEREVSEQDAPDLRRSVEPAPGPIERLLVGISGESSGEETEVPVFPRPSSGDSGGLVCGDLGDFPRSSRVVFPLPDEYFNSYDDTWGAVRPQGGHEGSDLMSPAGTPEFAITDGILVPVKRSSESGWNRLGGYTVMLEAAYDAGPIKEGDLFYYAHMDEESALPIGTRVRAGQKIGTVGDTGEGPEVTRGKFPSHLHLGWYDGSGDRTTLESGAMNPYPLLLWLEQNGGAVSGGTDVSYCEAPRSLVPEPSTGESSWPAPDSPGTTPDLDTGDRDDPRPSPAVEEPRRDHPPKYAEAARKDSPEKENEKVGKERKIRKASPKNIPEKREGRRAGTPARNESGSAREGARASRPSGAKSSPQPEPRDESQPFPTGPSRRSYASILADVIEEESRTTKDRDGRDVPEEEKREKPPDPTKNKSPKESRSVSDTRKTPATSEEKSEPEEREPEEKSAPTGTPGKPEDEEASPKGGPG